MKKDEPLVYTVQEAADLLKVSKKLMYEQVHKKQVPSLLIGGRILIPAKKLVAMVEGE